jgi:hypothetical protein
MHGCYHCDTRSRDLTVSAILTLLVWVCLHLLFVKQGCPHQSQFMWTQLLRLQSSAHFN